MARIRHLLSKSAKSLKTEGPVVFAKKAKNYIDVRIQRRGCGDPLPNAVYMDVLFINGCYLPHPSRYRVSHQREQLLASGISSNEVFFDDLTLELVKHYRMFIFFRCPYTDTIGEFIAIAKEQNKTVLFDIDDLVIDTKYTDQIKYIQQMSEQDRENYNSGVIRMHKTLSLCDAAITTTEQLAEELRGYVPEVFINRNVASEKMVKLSEEAVYERDVLPFLPPDKLSGRTKKKRSRQLREEAQKRKDSGVVRIGYFSGSITHNADIELILPALQAIMKRHENVQLVFAGEMDVPAELEPFQDRMIATPFVDWEKLPAMIADVDINIAPLEDTIFNRAKSENKWTEAALVKVPTIASRVGAFEKMIENGVTGLLCDGCDEWEEKLSELIEHPETRKTIAENAHAYATKHCITINSGYSLVQFLLSKMSRNLVMVLPSLQISGGILVALKHCVMLKKAGMDVLILNDGVDEKDFVVDGTTLFVLSKPETQIHAKIDKAVATLWSTLGFMNTYPNIAERYYLVQNYEVNFYKPGTTYFRILANQTYMSFTKLHYLTISQWCVDWLKSYYGKEARYARNGIDLKRFPQKQRSMSGKIRILVEGNSDDYYKNVDESFQIVERLDPDKYEIWFMSYQGKPKSWYRVDRFLHKIPNEQVGEIYAQCDILIKSSILESFSYPPLEMMATGGYCVVAPNEGNIEYLVDEQNCLLYERGNIDSAVEAINRICTDAQLRGKLEQGGLETAAGRDWSLLEEEILSLYGEEKNV